MQMFYNFFNIILTLNKSSSLQWKKFGGFRVSFFCELRYKWGGFLAILAHVTWLIAQSLNGSILLKFSLETRLESESWDLDQLSNISGSKVMA